MISPGIIADLHIHSTASDGTMSPSDIVAELFERLLPHTLIIND